MELTQDALLGGRLIYRQPRTGYRSGIEPVLLAASVCARPGERVLEAGTGAGAGLLCLLGREPCVEAIGVERNADLVAIARENLAENGFAAEIEHGDVLVPRTGPPFDHVFANPPWHSAGSTASGDEMRDMAKREVTGVLEDWTRALAKLLRPSGTLSLLVPASMCDRALAALRAAKCGSSVIYPLWPRAGQEARLLLLQARKLGRGGTRLLSGLVLHDACGYTPAARAVLWEGDPIVLR